MQVSEGRCVWVGMLLYLRPGLPGRMCLWRGFRALLAKPLVHGACNDASPRTSHSRLSAEAAAAAAAQRTCLSSGWSHAVRRTRCCSTSTRKVRWGPPGAWSRPTRYLSHGHLMGRRVGEMEVVDEWMSVGVEVFHKKIEARG